VVRGKQTAGSCAHTSPVVVEPDPKGRRARCLACGSVGLPRPSSAWALAALRDEAVVAGGGLGA
jgi:hypothetical protein